MAGPQPSSRTPLLLAAAAAALLFSVIQGPWEPSSTDLPRDAKVLKLADGRKLAYQVMGHDNATHTLFWMHGIISCRREVGGLGDLVTSIGGQVAYRWPREWSHLQVIGIDRPGYGYSDPHPNRTFGSVADDVRQLADHLGVQTFAVAGMSGGGPYAWACAAYLKERVTGVIAVGAVGDASRMNPKELESGPMRRFTAQLPRLAPSLLGRALHLLGRTRPGGALLHQLLVRPALARGGSKMSAGDKACLRGAHPEYFSKNLPEATRQRSGHALVDDIRLLFAPWPFHIADLPPAILRRSYVVHGADDPIVPLAFAQAAARHTKLPPLHVAPGGGHVDFWFCNTELQKHVFSAVLPPA